MPLNLHHLAIFRAVAQAGSVGGGAERLLISQPAVSKQLGALEKALGAPLLDRLPRGVRLTAAGALLLGYAERIFSLSDQAARAIDELRGVTRGRVAVGATTTIGVYLLPEAFVRFARAHPGVQLDLQIAHTDAIVARLLDGAIDIGLTESPAARADLESRVLLRDELIAIAAHGHPLARKRSVAIATLCREPFVVRETGSGTKSLVERALAERGLTIATAMSLASTEAIKRAVAGGVGVAIVSRWAAQIELRAGVLAQVRLRDLQLRRPWYLHTAAGRQPGHAAAAFERMLWDQAKQNEADG